MGKIVNMGHGRSYELLPWNNKFYPELESVRAAGAMIRCEHGEARIAFSISPEHDAVIAGPKFKVWQLDPLSLLQSVEGPCGCSGFIVDGRWINN